MSQPAGRDTYSHLHQLFLPCGPRPEAPACDPHLYGDLLGLVVPVTGGEGGPHRWEHAQGVQTRLAASPGLPPPAPPPFPYPQPPQPLVLTLILIP